MNVDIDAKLNQLVALVDRQERALQEHQTTHKQRTGPESNRTESNVGPTDHHVVNAELQTEEELLFAQLARTTALKSRVAALQSAMATNKHESVVLFSVGANELEKSNAPLFESRAE